eukprot:6211458-Pleurochrysis_carterae.AAC.2
MPEWSGLFRTQSTSENEDSSAVSEGRAVISAGQYRVCRLCAGGSEQVRRGARQRHAKRDDVVVLRAETHARTLGMHTLAKRACRQTCLHAACTHARTHSCMHTWNHRES